MSEEQKFSDEKMIGALRVMLSYYDYETLEAEALIEGIVQIKMNLERKKEMEMVARYAQEELDLG